MSIAIRLAFVKASVVMEPSRLEDKSKVEMLQDGNSKDHYLEELVHVKVSTVICWRINARHSTLYFSSVGPQYHVCRSADPAFPPPLSNSFACELGNKYRN